MSPEIVRPEFHNALVFPDLGIIESALKDSFYAYKELMKYLEENNLEYEWKYYNDGKTWLCKISINNKIIVWLSVWKEYFKTTVYVNIKYIKEIEYITVNMEKMKLILNGIENRKNIPCTFDIRNIEDLYDLFKVMEFKILNK